MKYALFKLNIVNLAYSRMAFLQQPNVKQHIKVKLKCFNVGFGGKVLKICYLICCR